VGERPQLFPVSAFQWFHSVFSKMPQCPPLLPIFSKNSYIASG
jgi:hypothetical protein